MTHADLATRLRLNVLTDLTLAAPRVLVDVVEAALQGGAPTIQFREKHAGLGVQLPLAREIQARCKAHGALFIVNDRLDLALAIEADGVHLGADDLPVAEARRLSPEGFIIGWSAADALDARRAVSDGADYLGAGTVWPTGSKADAGDAIGVDGVRKIAEAVQVPVVAIGGIDPTRTHLLAQTGAAGIAVISAVMAASDPEAATRTLLAAAERAFGRLG